MKDSSFFLATHVLTHLQLSPQKKEMTEINEIRLRHLIKRILGKYYAALSDKH